MLRKEMDRTRTLQWLLYCMRTRSAILCSVQALQIGYASAHRLLDLLVDQPGNRVAWNDGQQPWRQTRRKASRPCIGSASLAKVDDRQSATSRGATSDNMQVTVKHCSPCERSRFLNTLIAVSDPPSDVAESTCGREVLCWGPGATQVQHCDHVSRDSSRTSRLA